MFHNSPSVSNIATYILIQLQQVSPQIDNSKSCYSNGNYISCNATDPPCATKTSVASQMYCKTQQIWRVVTETISFNSFDRL